MILFLYEVLSHFEVESASLKFDTSFHTCTRFIFASGITGAVTFTPLTTFLFDHTVAFGELGITLPEKSVLCHCAL